MDPVDLVPVPRTGDDVGASPGELPVATAMTPTTITRPTMTLTPMAANFSTRIPVSPSGSPRTGLGQSSMPLELPRRCPGAAGKIERAEARLQWRAGA